MASQSTFFFLLVLGTLFLCAAKAEEVRGHTHVQLRTVDVIASSIAVYIYIQVHLKKKLYGEKVFSCNLFQKVKLSYILDSIHVK